MHQLQLYLKWNYTATKTREHSQPERSVLEPSDFEVQFGMMMYDVFFALEALNLAILNLENSSDICAQKATFGGIMWYHLQCMWITSNHIYPKKTQCSWRSFRICLGSQSRRRSFQSRRCDFHSRRRDLQNLQTQMVLRCIEHGCLMRIADCHDTRIIWIIAVCAQLNPSNSQLPVLCCTTLCDVAVFENHPNLIQRWSKHHRCPKGPKKLQTSAWTLGTEAFCQVSAQLASDASEIWAKESLDSVLSWNTTNVYKTGLQYKVQYEL